jgi:GLPGLI family protein
MKIINIIIVFFFSVMCSASAQPTRYLTIGSIEYDKSVNTYAILKKVIGPNATGINKTVLEQTFKQPHFQILKSKLIFNSNKTLFTPVLDENGSIEAYNRLPLVKQRNSIFIDFGKNTSVIQKSSPNGDFLVTDSIRKINWKITSELREIAGYVCRRANAIILDSVYVVAFYTTEIHVSGGPESFSGLPGMILEVVLPHDNVTWIATKVSDIPIPPTSIKPFQKGRPIDNRGLINYYNSTIKNSETIQTSSLLKLDYLL